MKRERQEIYAHNVLQKENMSFFFFFFIYFLEICMYTQVTK